MENGRESLRAALIAADIKEFDEINEGEIGFSPSRDLETRIKRLFTASKRPLFSLFNPLGKRVAAVILGALLIFAAAMSVTAVKKPIVDFITRIFENYTLIYVHPQDVFDAPRSIEKKYSPSFMLSPYILSQTNEEKLHRDMTYECDLGRIYFRQSVISSRLNIHPDENGLQNIPFKDGYAYCYSSGGGITFFWNEHGYRFLISADPALPIDTVMKIASGIECLGKGE